MSLEIRTSDDSIDVKITNLDLDASVTIFRYFSSYINSIIFIDNKVYMFASYSTGANHVDSFSFERQRELENEQPNTTIVPTV